ncbi:MAG: type II toxin-antitoxin system VapC family toxin [Gammaproteobacteria bacterium]|nr:type II toxin-antitoxin system VapC family toxin [Gammaproteobacteria bacterium]
MKSPKKEIFNGLQYLLDTNICIYIAKQKPISVLQKFEQMSVGEVGMSTITYGELLCGCHKSHQPKKALEIVEELTSLIPPLPISTDAGKYYAEIRSKLEKQGKPIGNNDLWIAAHALALNLVLITNNVKEFTRIKHLKVENWV